MVFLGDIESYTSIGFNTNVFSASFCNILQKGHYAKYHFVK